MKRGSNNIPVTVSHGACIAAAFLLLVIPLPWLAAAAAAAAFHELCHAVVILLMGGRILEMRIGLNGAAMETDTLSDRQELFAALAGPIGSFLLVFFVQWTPRIAFCGLIHGGFNLLPLFPLDGGRILHCLVRMVSQGRNEERICSAIETGMRIVLVIACIALRVGLVLPMLIFGTAFWRNREKHLAKMGK